MVMNIELDDFAIGTLTAFHDEHRMIYCRTVLQKNLPTGNRIVHCVAKQAQLS